jgi:hypothetical protein
MSNLMNGNVGGTANTSNSLNINSIVSGAVALLQHQSVLANKVYRDAEGAFVGGVGSKVAVRLINVIEGKEFDAETGTEVSPLAEGTKDITLTHWGYNAVGLTDRELTLNIENFGAQVMKPQTAGIAKMAEKAVAKVLNDKITAADAKNVVKKDDPLAAVAAASAAFTAAEVPEEDRTFAIGPDLQTAFQTSEALRNASASGSADTLRSGLIGRVYGFDVVVSPYITGGGVAFARAGVALAVRAPAPAPGAKSATAEDNGYAMRVLHTFDLKSQSNVSLASSFFGASELDARQILAFKVAA